MITTVRTMLTCRWAARRIQRYLDADPAALLDGAEVRRLEAHLVVCARCGGLAEEYRGLSRALAGWSLQRLPDPQLVARVRSMAEQLIREDSG